MRWPSVLIYDSVTGRPYMRRYYLLRTRWFGVFLHRIYLEDWSTDLHDHPWPFTAFVLRGWYEEELPCGDNERVRRRVTWVNRKGATDRHRIVKVSPNLWTLFIRGRRRREWGFHTEGGFVPWHDYTQLGGAQA